MRYIKFQLVAGLATSLDYITLFLLTEGLGLWYVYSASLALLSGAVCAFLFNRYWVFSAREAAIRTQVFAYAVVTLGNIALNVAVIYLLTSKLTIPYFLSKVITTVTVGLSYSYWANKKVVFTP